MKLADVIDVVGAIARAVPAATELLEAAASGFRAAGREEDARRVESVLPEKSRSRMVLEDLDTDRPPEG